MLHDALPADEYVVHANVDWLALGREPPGRSAGEMDVVICNKRKGVLVCEIKPGGIAVDGKAWFSTDRHGTRHAIADPVKQAQAGALHLREVLNRDPVLSPRGQRFRLPVGHAVILPHVRWKAELPLHMQPAITIDEGDLRDPRAAVDTAFSYWLGRHGHGGGLLPPQVRQLNWRLSPRVSLAISLAAVMREEAEQLIALSNEQVRILQALSLWPNMKVQGCAGSGKTMLALAESKRLADEGQSVLLLCFNRMLAGFLASAAKDHPKVLVRGFHQLCRDVCDQARFALEAPPAGHDGQAYWREHLPDAAAAHLGAYQERFDAIVVDEGQDFWANWWEVLQLMLRPEGRLVVFFDPNQDIFGTGCPIPIGQPPVVLHTNCRCTAAINQAAHRVGRLPLPSTQSPVEGTTPELITVKSGAKLGGAVARKLDALADDGVDVRSVVILSPRRLETSALAGRPRVGQWSIATPPLMGERHVQYATLQSFKGLEADVVLIVDLDLDSRSCSPLNLYAAFSRARHRLVVFGVKDQMSRLERILEAAGSRSADGSSS